ncbi:MAG: hypothetical protein OEZ06_09280 [Myxococcales bacterium]|nr:hypothetical protein [Myxococcales bacterium]
MPRLAFRSIACAIVLGVGPVACGGGNPYGYAPEYAPLSEEEPHFERGVALSYEEVRRNPAGFADRDLAWFGVVTGIESKGASGEAIVALELRTHQPRHLCSDQFDSSCRVTVSATGGGPFSALLTLRPEDRGGRDRVYEGSLLKVYGRVTPDFDDNGGPILRADYYRHWPRNTYVTPGHRRAMRR